MELIIVIFFFALTRAVCLQVFVKAHEMAKLTQSMNYAALWGDNACEVFFEYGNDPDKVRSTLEDAFDLKEFSFTCEFSEDEEFEYMAFTFFSQYFVDPVYEFTFKKHIMEVAR